VSVNPGIAFISSAKVGQTVRMGFNPHRQYRRKKADIPLVLVALVVIAALTWWGFAG
jgi:hypothetical protein